MLRVTITSPIGFLPVGRLPLEKIHCTFANCNGSILTENTYESNSESNWRNSIRGADESRVDFSQSAKVQCPGGTVRQNDFTRSFI